jgi:hypothetical protein
MIALLKHLGWRSISQNTPHLVHLLDHVEADVQAVAFSAKSF